jgi:sugar phosphate isomerase/epimerase
MNTCTRRRFLGASTRYAIAALITRGLPGVARATPLGGHIGIQLYAVKNALQADPAATLRAIKTIGFAEVETAGFGRLSAREFRALLDDAGLECPSAHLQFDPGDLGAAFEQAHALGARYAASGSLREAVWSAGGARPPAHGASPNGMTLDEAQRTAELANRIAARAKAAGLQYAYHNHDFEFAIQGDGAIGYDVLLRETDPGLVNFEVDCGWMVVGGRNPVEYFERYPGRFPMIHVKDFLPAPARNGKANPHRALRGAELGHGMIDYRPIFAAAEQAGLKHYFAEQEGPFAHLSELAAAGQAYAYLGRLP